MITEAEMSYKEMTQTAKTELCGRCGGLLNVAWDGQQYVLRCGNDVTHDTITRHDRVREDRINKTRRQLGMTQALTTMTQEQMLARIEQAKFPQDMTLKDKQVMALASRTYGFDPIFGELMIYQGRPFVSIDGRYRKAQETKELDGVETRPAKKQERIDWEIPDGDYFYRAEVWRKGATHAFVGWGRVRKSETVGGKGFKPIETNPQRMAEKRAEAQALRKGFNIPLPSAEDIGTPEGEVELKSPPKITVERHGRVTHTEKQKEEPPIDGEFTEGEPVKKDVPNRSLDEFKVLDDVVAACRTDFGLEPPDILTKLGKRTLEEITDEPFRVYLQIKQMMVPPAENRRRMAEAAKKETATAPIDLSWLQEQLKLLQGKKLAAWSNKAVLEKLVKITGKPAKTITEAVMGLTKEQAAAFCKEVQETVGLA